jgi:hypothetical protein
VRRLLALVLALTVAGFSTAVPSMHVHAYGGHDHPDHQHGPALHRHGHDHGAQAVAVEEQHGDHHHDGPARIQRNVIEACDPGEHAIRVPGTAVSLPQIHLQLAVLSSAIVAAPATPVRLALAPMDVRVHGPPSDLRLPARAPPPTFLA